MSHLPADVHRRLDLSDSAPMSGPAIAPQNAAEGPRSTALEWWEEDPNEDKCYGHVLLYRGFDLSAAGIWEHDIAPCLLCAPLAAGRDPALILTDETLHWGRLIHVVACGNCGTRGPWGDSESQALALWNAAHERLNRGAAV